MRRLNVKLFVILLCVLAVLSGATVAVHRLQASSISNALLYQVEQAEKDGRPDQAARFLGRYLEFEPQDLEQRARLGALLADPKLLQTPKGQKRAKFVLEQVLARAPEHHASRILLVKVALEARLIDAAQEHLTYLEKAKPDAPEVPELRAMWQEQKGLDEAATQSYRRALELAPERVENYLRLIAVLRRAPAPPVNRGDIAQARRAEIEKLSSKAIGLAPEHPGVLHLAAERAMEREDFAAARTHLEKGLEKYPKESRFLLGLARIEEKSGQSDKALALIQRGLDTLPKDRHFELRWAQANLCLDAGDLPKAQEAISRIAEQPGTETARAFLQGRVLMLQNLWFEAARNLERIEPAVKSSRDLALQVALYMGICYEHLNEPAKQLAAFKKVVEIDPSSQVGRRGIAMAHWSLGAYESALEALRENTHIAKEGKDALRQRLEMTRMLLVTNQRKGAKSYAAVEKELSAIERDHPDQLDTLLLRGEMLATQDKLPEAITLLDEALKRHADKPRLWLSLAGLYERKEEPAEADKLLAAAPDSVEVRLGRARLWVREADPEVSKKLVTLEGALDKFDADDRAKLFYGLGTAQFQAGKPKEAQRLWWQITTLPRHAANARIRLLLLDLAVAQNDEPAMNRVLEDLKKLDADSKEGGTLYRFGLATHHLWQARKGQKEHAHVAKKLLMAVEAERPNWDAAYLSRAEADEILGNLDQAISHYRKAMELGQRSQEVTRKLVFLLSQTHRFDEAEKEINRLQKDAPLEGDLQRLAVAISVQRDDYSKAEQLIRKSMTGKTKDWRDHLWLGQVLAADGRTADAEKELRVALEMAGDQSEPHVALVRLLVRQGQTDKAQTALDVLKEKVNPEKQDVTLAQCLEILGRFDEAEKHLVAALKRQPTHPVLNKMHAGFLFRTGKLAEAEPVLRVLAASRTPEDAAWAKRALSLVLVAGGKTKHAKEAFEHVGIKIDDAGNITEENATEEPEELLARAKVLAMQQRRPLRTRAITLLENLQKKHALAPEDQFLLAQLYINQGREPVWWGKARDTLIGLVKSYPRHPQYLLLFAQQSLVHKDLAEAERLAGKLEQVEKSRGLPAGELGTIELRARVHEASGNGKKALAVLQDYAALPGAPPERAFMVATMHGRLGNLKEAIETCLAVKTTPENKARTLVGILRRFHTSTFLHKNKALWDEQIVVAERALKDAAVAHSDKLVLLLHLADLHDLLGRYDDVEALCRQVLEVEPNNMAALNNLAWMLSQRKTQPAEALKLINRAIEIHGPRPELLDTRAVVYLNQGLSEPALADLDRATRDAPSAAKFFNLARAHHLNRDNKSALEALNQATSMGLDELKLHPAERETYRRVVADLKGR